MNPAVRSSLDDGKNNSREATAPETEQSALGDHVDLASSEDGDDDLTPGSIRLSPLETKVFETVAGPEERSESVVSVLNGLREAFDADPAVDDVREALQRLKRIGVVEVIYRAVPTFRACVDREEIRVTTNEE